MNKDFNNTTKDDTKVNEFIEFSQLFSLEENTTNYSNKSAGDFFEYMIQIKPEKSMEEIELSCMIWVTFHLIFIETIIKNEIVSADWYANGLLFCCNEFSCEEKCEYFAYILNHYYRGEMNRIFEDLISKEDYETCAKLMKYRDINKIPPSVFDYF